MGAGCRQIDRAINALPMRDTPTPLRGEGWGGGESDAWLVTPACGPLSLTLPREGGGDSCLVSAAVTQTYEKSSIADQQSLTSSKNTPSPSTGEGWGEGDQRTVASADDSSTPTLAIPPQGGGDSCLVSAAVIQSHQKPFIADQQTLIPSANTPSPLRGEG